MSLNWTEILAKTLFKPERFHDQVDEIAKSHSAKAEPKKAKPKIVPSKKQSRRGVFHRAH